MTLFILLIRLLDPACFQREAEAENLTEERDIKHEKLKKEELQI